MHLRKDRKGRRDLVGSNYQIEEVDGMTFGEKLFKLRKSRGMSQEALAEQLHTTRQAISRWENDQGYPETEKLLLLSNIFEVSVDSLLKENTGQAMPSEEGYYVSRERAEGFLSFHRKTTARTAAGVAVIALSGVPYFLFIENQTLSITLACVVIVIGLAFVLSVAMMGNPYREMKNERLLFDPAYYSELNASYQAQKKTSLACIILMIVLISAAGILGLAELSTFPVPEIQCVLTACAAYLFVYVIGIMDAYDVLTHSGERMNSAYWRIKRKILK